MTPPALYVGSVMHRRLRPCAHRFRYRAFWILADLDTIDDHAARLVLFSRNRFNLFSLNEHDHGDGSDMPLRHQIDRLLVQHGFAPQQLSVSIFCMPRTLGYGFNPLSLYFCRKASGELAAIVYEVHNTFGERHSYVLAADTGGRCIRQNCLKSFRVSPFLGDDLRYTFAVTEPGERFAMSIRTDRDDDAMLLATLVAGRRPLSDRALATLFLFIPAVTLKVIAAIHWEALRLWLKGLRPTRRQHASTAAGLARS